MGVNMKVTNININILKEIIQRISEREKEDVYKRQGAELTGFESRQC